MSARHPVTLEADAGGGCSLFRHNDLDETKREVKSSAGCFYGGIVINLKASVLYLQIFDNPAASVTVGSDTPDMQIPIPTQGDTNGAGFVIPVPACGVDMANGVTVGNRGRVHSRSSNGIFR